MIARTEKGFVIENEKISRTLEWTEKGIRTVSFVNRRTGQEYIHNPGREFLFTADLFSITGYEEPEMKAPRPENVSYGIAGEKELVITFDQGPVRVSVIYTLHKDCAGIVKRLKVTSLADHEIKLEKFFFDWTCPEPGKFADCDLYAGAGNRKLARQAMLDGTDDIVRCHNRVLNEGWIEGTTAPGNLRFFLVYPNWGNVCNGYSSAAGSFARYLKPGETFVSDASLVLFYQDGLNSPEPEKEFRDLIRAELNPLPVSSGIMYCTWLPFLKEIDEKLITDLAERAEKLGFNWLVLDDGWFREKSEWTVDTDKFPNGLERISEIVHSHNLRFGLWFNVGTDYGMAPDSPRYDALEADGTPKKLGFVPSNSISVQCFASAHRDRMVEKLTSLAEKLKVDYFKLDFSFVYSPYGLIPYGCHAHDHAYHKGFSDSSIQMYRSLRYMKEALTQRFPKLIVDISFECFGPDSPDIASLTMSELHHVSNDSGKEPKFNTITDVRRNFCRWGRYFPPERLLHGLLTLRHGEAKEYLLTSFCGAPLVAGDLKTLTAEECRIIRLFTDTFRKLSEESELTELEIVASGEDFDGFRRSGKNGHGFLALFNRRDTPVYFRTDYPCRNVETGEAELFVPAHDCLLAVFRGVKKCREFSEKR